MIVQHLNVIFNIISPSNATTTNSYGGLPPAVDFRNNNIVNNNENENNSVDVHQSSLMSPSSSSSNNNLVEKLLHDCFPNHRHRSGLAALPSSPPTDNYERPYIFHENDDDININNYKSRSNDYHYNDDNNNNNNNHNNNRFSNKSHSSSFYISPPPPAIIPPSSSSSTQEEREQALRDYKVTIEYKHLKSHAPGGVYLIPSMDSLREFYGIIFVRRGPFTNGIFKFKLTLPPKYNDVNMWPYIVFASHVYNPYVNEETGELDVQGAYPTWDPSRHYLVTVLTYLKKIFYSKNFTDAKANIDAKQLAENDLPSYKQKVEECVHESQKNVYVNDENSTAIFTEEEVAHRVLRDLLKHHIKNENQVTKQAVLTQIDKASKV